MLEDSQVYDQRVTETISEIKSMYLDTEDDKEWVVAWSGGKDSTVVLGLVTRAIEDIPKGRRSRNIHVILSDTRVENPVLGAYMYDQVDKFNSYAIRQGLPMKAEVVKRPIQQSYFVLTLGRGYFLPMRNGQGRWCTERLKINPSNAKFTDIKPSYKIVGTRSAESGARARSIESHRISHKITEDSSSSDSLLYMPIVDWSVDDVWEYLGDDNLGWSSTEDVRELYEEATGECGVTNPQGVESKAKVMESCGARFGCWLCPVITSDRSTEEMSNTQYWLTPLTEYRELQMKVYGQFIPTRPEGQRRKDRSKVLRKWESINEQIKNITKAGYNRHGRRMKDGQGTLTVEARRFLFDRLIETEKKMNFLRVKNQLPKIDLISEEEVKLIKETWKEDELNYQYLVTNSCGRSIKELEGLLYE